MFDEPQQALRAMNSLASASSKHLGMTLRCAGIMPRDPNVPKAVLQSKPFTLLYPLTPASLAIKKVAASIHGEPVVVEPESNPGFFRRFAKSLGVAI
jgi:MinD-like ATPase involved in chromosome partitioning or flagellar assembly